jgi:hypothetical protein
MSEFQFSAYEKVRKDEADTEKKNKTNARKNKNKGDELFTVASTYRIFSRACCNFAFPNPPGRPMPDSKKEILDQDNDDNEYDENVVDAVSIDSLISEGNDMNEDEIAELKSHIDTPNDYNKRIKDALATITDNVLTHENLQMYSPKFLKILENLQDENNVGLHLLYSQFRTIEGIAILKIVLETNGFAEFKLQKNPTTDEWDIMNFEENAGKPQFVLYTGTETVEEKEIIRNIWNSSWSFVPSSIVNKMKAKAENNFYGEIVKILMITASGAEGINLRNTRYVHIVEPYWHLVRIEQVIGRARRICSHQDLPPELRTLKVFLYLSIFSEEQKTNRKNIELMNRDTSKLDGRPVSTDESLADIATIKNNINQQLLKSVKETAMDCNLYARSNRDEGIVCYGYGKVSSNEFGSYPSLEKDSNETTAVDTKKERIKLHITKEINGKKYAVDKQTGELFDLDSYYDKRDGKGELRKVGQLVGQGRNLRIDFIA